MTPAGFLISYVLAAVAISVTIKFKRRKSDRWQRGVPRQFVVGWRARLSHVTTDRSSTYFQHDRGPQRRAA